MEYILREPIKIGISACNFGAKVRWNNVGWDRGGLKSPQFLFSRCGRYLLILNTEVRRL